MAEVSIAPVEGIGRGSAAAAAADAASSAGSPSCDGSVAALGCSASGPTALIAGSEGFAGATWPVVLATLGRLWVEGSSRKACEGLKLLSELKPGVTEGSVSGMCTWLAMCIVDGVSIRMYIQSSVGVGGQQSA